MYTLTEIRAAILPAFALYAIFALLPFIACLGA
jgi:hypothetical protein